MISFKQSINEVFRNDLKPNDGIDTFEKDYFKKNRAEIFKDAKKSKSNVPDHSVYSKETKFNDGTVLHDHYWMHNKTGDLNFKVSATVKPGAHKKEKIYSNISSYSSGAGIGHHAYWDLMSGRTGHHVVMTHDNMSVGASKLLTRVQKHYKGKVQYHTFHDETGEAKPYTHGVIAAPGMPKHIANKNMDISIVGMAKPKYRENIK